ncbi:uncharacterized protein L969DRAFT_91285 [Mixia osmundae IAM 14324]|uniref:Nuclear protein localization protein 4 n=1 Tax=Mixia osmundae (strain CBS 9802 / IAM 14324 / JCM 22182 / KY 12970) TaxID=764103 RepID=G7DSR2_MIXOS|nr:uncharacterized protein L969DRAFT_91285 [Mixia osmundae IAM 14324]KEI41802.1 hypothetical protein L969DRAFT_91285 [Mixia osmundae IAM 14324]GAA93620.1 hypothetical protein E5Q_00264 [Mixia osmundae IAM 14324]
MLVRIRCRRGNFRFQIEPTDDISVLSAQILNVCPDAQPETIALSTKPRGDENLLSTLQGSLASLGIGHGDLLFVSYTVQAERDDRSALISNGSSTTFHGEPTSTATTISSVVKPDHTARPWEAVQEDPVDRFWQARDGKISRPRDQRMCKHGDKSMCDYCMPLEPYDAKFHEQKQIKHLSFQAYLRSLDTSAANKQRLLHSSWIPPLDEPDYKVAVPCPSGSHASWPNGICTKCQPSAITLQLQNFRMVDHVEFASPQIVENVLAFWRKTTLQRFGYLIGHYEPYDSVPMGVKAVVEAVHEPAQEGDSDGVRLGMPWQDEARIQRIASQIPTGSPDSRLTIVGMIFTDLTPPDDEDAKRQAKVVSKRHAKSYFMSCLETIFAAQQQQLRPNPSKYSRTGRYSSRFVTCILTGNTQGEIEVTAYQASNQAVAMVDADIIEPSVEPAVVRIKEEDAPSSVIPGAEQTKATQPNTRRYVPDVFYRYKNRYGIDVKESAKPCFPTDYLLVSLTNGFPSGDARPLFQMPFGGSFPIESRQGLEDQTSDLLFARLEPILAALPERISSHGKGKAPDAASLQRLCDFLRDWHLLCFIDSMSILDEATFDLLCKLAGVSDETSRLQYIQALLASDSWQTLSAIAREHAAPTSANAVMDDSFAEIPDVGVPPNALQDTAGVDDVPGVKICPHCTYENSASAIDCEICSLPLA